ncbi:WXG100 family type VII secretion target [Nocardia alba]|uniref:Type VII secretion system (Wss) protein ESAT-6 n=1 Tax=Nocardia alba TaxID=225051 RepID=A0A4R1G0Y8_9NOCA|nr:WXG100 family type VII secretion target [Nocardia alba]TCJ99779.1 type VII secretion system (Wss) protein ESAT-6 [Nocardia alba]
MSKAPSECLTEPSPEDPLSDQFEFLITSNAISPSYWVCKWCENVLGTDPLKWVTSKISGDWEALQKAGKAVENLAAYSSTFSDSVKSAATTVDATWDGNAATSAQAYFTKLSSAVSAQVGPLQEMADEINRFASSAYHLATAMSNALQALLDWGAIALIQLAAAEVAGLTGVGLVATAALVAAASLTILKVIKAWNDLVQTFNTGYAALEGIAGVGFGVVAVVESADMPALPNTSYDHPGA